MSEIEQGLRYYGSPDRTKFQFIHPAAKEKFFADWTDCTDMNDEEYDAFVAGQGD